MLTEGCSNTATSLPSHPITRYHSSIPLVRLVLSCQVNSSLKIGLETRAMRYSVSDVASSCATRSKTRKICAPPSLKGRASVNILNSKFRTVKQRNLILITWGHVVGAGAVCSQNLYCVVYSILYCSEYVSADRSSGPVRYRQVNEVKIPGDWCGTEGGSASHYCERCVSRQMPTHYISHTCEQLPSCLLFSMAISMYYLNSMWIASSLNQLCMSHSIRFI